MIHSPFATSLFIWVGISFCIIQSAIFSGLNLAIFSVSKLRLEVEAAGGNRDAISLLGLRKDSNLTLSAVLWGNVTINVLLTLLSDSVLAGVGAFAFSTFVITLFGEIIPQAYFSRHALRMAHLAGRYTQDLAVAADDGHRRRRHRRRNLFARADRSLERVSVTC